MALTLLPRRRAAWTDADRLAAILDGLPVAAIVCDLDMTVVTATPRAHHLFADLRGAIREQFHTEVTDLIGLNLAQFLTDPAAARRLADNPAVLPHAVAFAVGGRRFRTEIDAARRQGEVLGLVAVIDDVTDREALTSEFTGAAAELGNSASELNDTVARLGGVREMVSGHSDALSTGMVELLDLMNSVADGAVMIRESTLAVVDSAHQAGGNVAELAEASGTIGEFTATISSIAEQTKLLALNATIEATRAGAAGSGFGVVAQEVKNLAQRSAVAAEKISSVVESIQRSSQAAGTALATINEKVDIVGGQQLSVNVIVDNQVAKVEEIVGITRDLADAVADLDDAVAATTGAAGAVFEGSRAVEGVVASLNAAE